MAPLIRPIIPILLREVREQRPRALLATLRGAPDADAVSLRRIGMARKAGSSASNFGEHRATGGEGGAAQVVSEPPSPPAPFTFQPMAPWGGAIGDDALGIGADEARMHAPGPRICLKRAKAGDPAEPKASRAARAARRSAHRGGASGPRSANRESHARASPTSRARDQIHQREPRHSSSQRHASGIGSRVTRAADSDRSR